MLSLTGPFEYVPQTGTRGRGHSYERAVCKYVLSLVESLGWTLYDHYWIHTGSVWVQPDFIIQTPACAIILEAKLTYIDCSAQLARYIRAAQAELGCPVWGAQVCQNLTPHSPQSLCLDFFDLEPNCTWHFRP